MHALATKRGLLGLVVLVVCLIARPSLPGPLWAARPTAAPPSSAAAPSQAPNQAPPVHIPPFAAPASMPALGEELARALYSALRDANIPARLGKGDDGSAIAGRLEELSQTQVRLHASYHGHSVQSVGDLEHLDDLVYAVFAQLRPRLQATAPLPEDPHPGAPQPASGTSPPPSTPPAGSNQNDQNDQNDQNRAEKAGPAPSVTPSKPPAVKDAQHPTAAHNPATHHPPQPHPGGQPPAKKPEPTASTGTAGGKEAPTASTGQSGTTGTTGTTASSGNTPSPPADPPSTPPGPGPVVSPTPPTPIGPPQPGPRPAPSSDLRRPRVAVHIVGDPIGRLPPGYYGLGPLGQQNIVTFLHQRLHIPAVASRLVGLTGGLAALEQSLVLGARHTLMVRMDSLVLTQSPSTGPGVPSAGTLAGRVHIVLLFDGKLLFDRSVTTQPTLVLPTEPAAQAYSRLLLAAVGSVAGELGARIQLPALSPGPG